MFEVSDHLRIGPARLRRLPEGVEPRPYELFGLTGLSPTIGAAIDGICLRDLDDATFAELHRALLEWKVLFLRDQDLDRDAQRDLARRWGPIEQHPFFRHVQPGQEDVDVVTLAKDAANVGTENEWHADLTWHATPSFGAVLRAVEVPPIGGDTLWADAAAAYDGLPDEVRSRIDLLGAEHDWRQTFGMAMDPELVESLGEQFPPARHPVVRVHPETGRRTLFVNPYFTQRVAGLDHDASEELLALLYRQFTRPEYQCRFRWEPGSVAIWDNRATQHYAASDYAPQRRVMDRVSIAGDRPVGDCDVHVDTLPERPPLIEHPTTTDGGPR